MSWIWICPHGTIMQTSNIGLVNNLFYYVGARRRHRCVNWKGNHVQKERLSQSKLKECSSDVVFSEMWKRSTHRTFSCLCCTIEHLKHCLQFWTHRGPQQTPVDIVNSMATRLLLGEQSHRTKPKIMTLGKLLGEIRVMHW